MPMIHMKCHIHYVNISVSAVGGITGSGRANSKVLNMVFDWDCVAQS